MDYNDAIKELLDKFPGYEKSNEIEGYDRDLPYLLYAGFAEYFRRRVNELKNPMENEEIIGIVHFLDEMASSKDKKTLDLLIAGFFESVINSKKEFVEKPLKVLNSLLNKKTKYILKEIIEWKPPITVSRILLEDDEQT